MLNQYEEWMLWQWWWLACLPACLGLLRPSSARWVELDRCSFNCQGVNLRGREREESLNGSPNNWIDGIIGGAYRLSLSLSLLQLESDSMMAFNFNFVASSFYRPIGHIITYLLYLGCSDGRVRCQSVEGDYLSVMWRHHPSIDDDDQVQSCAKAAM